MTGKRSELAKYWLTKATRSLQSAENEYHSGHLDFCANRLYYAVFYAVSAVLMYRGRHYRKHSGVRAALHREFVKTGLVPARMGILYDALLRDREDADYMAFTELDPEVLKEELIQVKEFLDIFQGLLQGECES